MLNINNFVETFEGEEFLDLDNIFGITNVKEEVFMRPHLHNFIEICYVYSGNGRHYINGNIYNVHPGDLYIIDYGTVHAFESDSDGRINTFNIMFLPEFFDPVYKGIDSWKTITEKIFADNGTHNVFINIPHGDIANYNRLTMDMFREYTARKYGYSEMIRGLFLQFMINIIRDFAGINHINPTSKMKKSDTVEFIKSYFDHNYEQKIYINSLCESLYINKSHLCRLFKEYTGTNMIYYINRKRIQKACELLKETDSTIISIAIDVGFKDYKHFNNVFNEIMGENPTKYREGLK